MTPIRELANQIYSVLCSLLAFHTPSATAAELEKSDHEDTTHVGERKEEGASSVDCSSRSVIPQLLLGGNIPTSDDLKLFLRRSPNLLIATPGRLLELLCSPSVHCPSHSFELLILDEADRLLDLGFKTDLQKILARLPKQRRTGLFSASVSEAVDQLVRVGLRNPVRVTVKVKSTTGIPDKRTPASLDLTYTTTPSAHKISTLVNLLARYQPLPQKVIIFFATCASVDYFQHVLPSLIETHQTISLHGKHPPNARNKNFSRFVDAVQPVCLLTTDVAARGLDIPTVDLVIQFDPPSDPKTFLHRAGRAGRAGRRGSAVIFLRPGREEDYVRFLDVRDTPVLQLLLPDLHVKEEEAVARTEKTRKLVLSDRALHEKAQRAFVSWVRAYKTHVAASIFRVTDLDWESCARDWGLLRLPRMPEAKGWNGDRSLGLQIDWQNYRFRDKVREKKRKLEIENQEKGKELSSHGEARQTHTEKKRIYQGKDTAWSQNKQRQSVREARREKRQIRQKRIRSENMTPTEKLKQDEVQRMIAEVREQRLNDEDEFQGFGD